MGGTAFSGNFSRARAYAVGDVSSTNLAGTGSATWTGIDEANPVGAYERLMDTATVTTAVLERPLVGVAVDIPGHSFDAPGLANTARTNGGFSSRTAGTDWLGGNFRGPDDEEAWGLFDTADHLGACGAKRQP